jgi:predicted small secreted protein
VAAILSTDTNRIGAMNVRSWAFLTARSCYAPLVFALTLILQRPAKELPMRKSYVIGTLAAALVLAGCANTLGGAGQDAKSAGKTIEKTANDVKKKL